MESFLNKLSKEILLKHEHNMEGLLVVLPSKRAKLFLKEALRQNATSSFFAPKLLSIEEFIIEASGKKNIEPIELLFLFYKSYQEQVSQEKDSFEDFISWASIILSDFNDIDAYLINTKLFFDFINQERAITVWNPSVMYDDSGAPIISEFQKNYLEFWKSLRPMYQSLHEELGKTGHVYPGMAYRQVAENVKTLNYFNGFSHVVFAGFNALNKAEEVIIQHLVKVKKASVYWDSDSYYLKQHQEAGHYLRQHVSNTLFGHNNVSEFNFITNHFKEAKEIFLYGVPKAVTQVKVASEILKSYGSENQTSKALVLADEKLLLPMLQSIPNNVSDINVTMGYSLKYSQLFSFFFSLIKVYETARLSKTGAELYSTHLLEFVQHPLFKKLGKDYNAISIELKNYILKTHTYFVTLNELDAEVLPLSHAYLNEHFNSTKVNSITLIERLKKYCESFDSGEMLNSMQAEELSKLKTIVNKLSDLFGKYELDVSVNSFKNIFSQLCILNSVDFFGEPLKGLQIMGTLETRTLDFEELILVGVNEGNLPSGKKHNSFVPYDIKKIFELPTYTDKDAIFAYHFYRLISKAKKIHLIYNADSEDFGSGERSRFIAQLQEELRVYNSDSIVKEIHVKVEEGIAKYNNEIQVIKSEQVIHKIKEKLQKGISPSAINTYKACSLQFYFKYVLGWYEEDEIKESVDAADFGTIVHAVLEHIYKDWVGKELMTELLSTVSKEKIAKISEQVFLKESKRKKIDGKNHLLLVALNGVINNFIKFEKDRLSKKPVTLVALEQELIYDTNYNGIDIKLKGFADRIEGQNGLTSIIDYKTGKVEKGELFLKDISLLHQKGKHEKLFQIWFYAYVYHKSKNQDKLSAQIISFKNLKGGVLTADIEGNTLLSENEFTKFEQYLFLIIEEMLNDSNSFVQTSNLKVCENCAFVNSCNR